MKRIFFSLVVLLFGTTIYGQITFAAPSDYANDDLVFWLFGDGYHAWGAAPTHYFGATQTPNTQSFLCKNKKPDKPKGKSYSTYPVATTAPIGVNNIRINGRAQLTTSWTPVAGAIDPINQHYYIVSFTDTNSLQRSGWVELHYDDTQQEIDINEVIVRTSWLKSHHRNSKTSAPYTKKITMRFEGLTSLEQRHIYIKSRTKSSVKAGDTLRVKLCFLYESNGIDPEVSGCEEGGIGNSGSIASRFPHDPNSKVVDESCIDPNTETTLTYVVKFQNDATGFANNITISDVLPAQYVTNSFMYLGGSLAGSCVATGSTMLCAFDSAMLPGSNQMVPRQYEYHETEGYIRFSISVIGAPCDVISNSATIVFDSQPPITTNAAITDVKMTPASACNCEGDQDHDTVLDATDNCAAIFNTDQLDNDGDNIGDACDAFDAIDFDSDGIVNTIDTDDDNDGNLDTSDCNSFNSAIYVGALDWINGIDDNCDAAIDNGCDCSN